MKKLHYISIILAALLLVWACKKKEEVVPTVIKSNAKDILSFSIDGFTSGQTVAIDTTKKTITITLPNGTDKSNLKPNIQLADKANSSPASGAAQNFNNPIVYKIIAENGSTVNYTVTVIAKKLVFAKVEGVGMKAIYVGNENAVWGISLNNTPYYYDPKSLFGWVQKASWLTGINVFNCFSANEQGELVADVIRGHHEIMYISKSKDPSFLIEPSEAFYKQMINLTFTCIASTKNQIFWGIDKNQGIYKYDTSMEKQWAKIDGALVQLSMGADNTVYGVNVSNMIFKWKGTGWSAHDEIKGRFKHVSIGRADFVWAISSDSHVKKLNAAGTDWEEPVPDARLESISASADGTVWGVNSKNEIFRLEYQ